MNNDLNMNKIDDTISRKAAIEALGEKPVAWSKGEYERGLQNQWGYDVSAIKKLPSAQPEHIKARWLPIGIVDAVGGESAMWGDEIAYHACDNCWQQALEKDGEEVLSDFCPHCGADMRGEQDG